MQEGSRLRLAVARGSPHSEAGTCPSESAQQVKTHGMVEDIRPRAKAALPQDHHCPGHSMHKDTEAVATCRTLVPHSGLRAPPHLLTWKE